MMPVTHLLVGAWAGQTLTNKFRSEFSSRFLLFYTVLGSVLPDIDFISRFLGPGYYDNRVHNIFLSHRGFTHSILGVIFLSISVTGLTAGYFRLRHRSSTKISWKGVFLPVFLGGLTHLACDLPSPSTIWGGIPLFFPLRWHGHWARVGGWSLIGWYDYVALYISLVAVIMNTLPCIRKHTVSSRTRMILNLSFLALLLFHISTARYDSKVDYYLAEAKWRGLMLKQLPDCLITGPEKIRKKTGYLLFYRLPALFR